MRSLALASFAVLLGAGCLPSGTMPDGTTFHGQLVPVEGVQAGPPVRVAVLWMPSWFKEGTPPVVSDVQEMSLDASTAAEFDVTFLSPPPEAALMDLAASGGKGKAAYGILVAFEDGNGNGTLDLGTASSASPDRIAGVSDGDWSRPPPLHHHFLVYLEGELGKDDYFFPFELQMGQGYTLFEVHSDYGVRIAPEGTAAGIEVTRADQLQWYGCGEADFSWWLRTACGVDPLGGDYNLWGTLAAYRETNLYIEDTHGPRSDAKVTLNGAVIPYDAQSGSYHDVNRPPVGSNTLQIEVPGHPTEVIQVTVPAPVQLTTSLPATAPRGTSLRVAWSDDPGVELYDVLVYDQDLRYLFHDNFNENSFTIPPVSEVGQVQVRVIGLGPLAIGSSGHWIRGVNRAAGTIMFQN